MCSWILDVGPVVKIPLNRGKIYSFQCVRIRLKVQQDTGSYDLWSPTLGPFSSGNLNGVKTDSRSWTLLKCGLV